MNSRIILIEGIPGTGKTTLINLLIKRYVTENEKIKTLFHLSQLHTYRPIVSDEDNFYASKTETLNHLKKKLQLFNWSVSVGNIGVFQWVIIKIVTGFSLLLTRFT